MRDYNYLESVTEDVRNYISENINLKDWKGDREGLEEELNDTLWSADSVTGNASNSYFFNSYKAEEALCHNWDLLSEALEAFGQSDRNILEEGPEAADVTIRCYVLPEAIATVLDELEENGKLGDDEESEEDAEEA